MVDLETMEQEGNILVNENPKALQTDSTPSEDLVVGREREMNKVASIVKRRKNLLIKGCTGVGKSMSVDLTLNEMNESYGFNSKVIKVQNVTSQRGVLTSINDQLEATEHKGYDLDKYYKGMRNKLIEDEIHLVIVLDELENLFQRKVNGSYHGNSLIKRLKDEVEKPIQNSDADASLTWVGITNNTRLDEKFNSKVQSRKEEEYTFDQYYPMDLEQILKKRAEKAFEQKSIEEGSLKKIGALASQKTSGGDARFAIKVLRKAAEMAEDDGKEKMKKKYIDRAVNEIRNNNYINSLENVNTTCRIVFYSALKTIKEDDGKKVETTDAYSNYQDVCDIVLKDPVNEQNFTRYISELNTINLLNESVKSKGRYGRTKTISSELNTNQIDTIMDKMEERYWAAEFDR